MKILIIDNYDSFTYNLVHMVEDITGIFPDVYRNDKISISEIANYDLIMLSPGPGIPEEAGILKQVVKTYYSTKPIFAVCLGLQAITEVFGGTITNMEKVYHGVATTIKVVDRETLIFQGLPEKFEAGRYHSWISRKEDFPSELKITAIDNKGGIMALAHKTYNISAVQFHPESILTPLGEKIVHNFIDNVR